MIHFQKAILIIVEEENLRRSLTLLLERSDYVVESAINSEEALLKIQSGQFDLALIDIKINSRLSKDLISRISQLSPGLPILVMAPEERVKINRQLIELIVKPVDPQNLLAHLNGILLKESSSEPE